MSKKLVSKTNFCSIYLHSDLRFEILIREPVLKNITQQSKALGNLSPFKRFLPKSCTSRALTDCEFVDAADLPALITQFLQILANPVAAQKQLTKASAGFQLQTTTTTAPVSITNTNVPYGVGACGHCYQDEFVPECPVHGKKVLELNTCPDCGEVVVKSGACSKCHNCGWSEGCS